MIVFLIIAAILLICAVVIYRFPMLMAGYNTMSGKERARYNINKIKKVSALTLVGLALLSVVFYFLSERTMTHIVWLVLFIATIIGLVITVNTSRFKNKQE